MNVELLRKVVEHAEEEPRRFNMATWYTNAVPVVFKNYIDVPPCGAVGCVAGTVCIISGKATGHYVGDGPDGRKLFEYDIPQGGWFRTAEKLLDLTHEQAKRLFYTGGHQDADDDFWPEKFRQDYFDNTFNPEGRVKVLRTRVEHFIATNGAE